MRTAPVILLPHPYTGQRAEARPAFGRDRYHVKIDGQDQLFGDDELRFAFGSDRRAMRREAWGDAL
jgi:hypothetical protein